jgi:hypothetical protein
MTIRRASAVAAATLLAVAGTACGPTPSAIPSALSSAEATDGSAASLCAGAEVRGPDGSRVDLTGTWRGFLSGLLFVTQTGSCVGIEGLSNHPDEPLGSEWRSIFTGDLNGEFTVVGRWMWTRWVANPVVTTGDTVALTMQVDFDDQNQPVIQIAPLDVCLCVEGDRVVLTLERISSSTAYPD